MKSDWERVEKIFARAVFRMLRGSATYGEFNPATDTRNLLHEAQEELLDAMNYLAMHYLKLETLKNPKKEQK